MRMHSVRGTPRVPTLCRLAAMAAGGCALAALSLAVGAAPPTANAPPPATDATPRLGRPITAAQAATAGTSVFPDGRGLPAGRGDARTGKAVFEQQCARCHGAGGRGGSAPELVGGTIALNGTRPDKTIGLYWPYAATLFDFNRRAMPMDKPGSLSVDETYAVTAYLLFAEGLIGDTTVMNQTTLPRLNMPNRDGFRWIDATKP